MKVKTLGEIEASIEQLDLSDQVRLLQFLAPKIAEAILIKHAHTEEVSICKNRISWDDSVD